MPSADPSTSDEVIPPRQRKIVTGPLPPLADGAPSEASVSLPGTSWEIVIPEAILTKIAVNASKALQVDRCALALFDPSAGELVTVVAVPTPAHALRRSRFRPGEGIAGEVARTQQPLLVTDASLDSRFKRLGEETIRSLICAPLLDEGRMLGTMTASSHTPFAFNEAQLDLLSIFADQAALAISQARRAEEVDRLKSAVLSTVSHELRTPLSSIRGFVEIILSGRTGDLTPLQRDFLESVQASTKQLTRLVEDIMQVSLAEAGHLRLEWLPTNIDDLCRAITRQLRPQAEAAGVDLSFEAFDDVPPVECDPARIEQVLGNIIANAVKFTPAGGRVRVALAPDGDGALVHVADTGPGIPPNELDRVFDRLYQVQHGLNRAYGGVGLGLTIAKHLVEGHGGQISVASEVGAGTTFTIYLPYRFKRGARH